jgi:hypothetical protein
MTIVQDSTFLAAGPASERNHSAAEASMIDAASERDIYDALVALRRRGAEGSFVIVEHLPTGKFVQFGRGPVLDMDVPCVSLTAEEADRAAAFFRDLGGVDLREYDDPNPETAQVQHGAAFRFAFGDDAARAARAAILFFARVTSVPLNGPLTITEV